MTDAIQIHFEQFHRDNPQVYQLFDRFTHQMIERGYKPGSAKLISERIRWETAIVTTGIMVKLNNNYTSRYARLWEKNNPAHAGFFRKRRLHDPTTDSVKFDEARP